MKIPIRSKRLLLRPARIGDAATLAAPRSQPEDDAWRMLVITDPARNVTYGDVALRLSWSGRTAEIGYALAREHWGHGYATEAVQAVVKALFDELPITRIEAKVHPDNIASAAVIERTGFIFEGQTRLSSWVGDHNTDDCIYAITRPDWEMWRDRTVEPPVDVKLVEITTDNERTICRLRTHKSQERMVAPMMASFTDALFPEVVDGYPVAPWFRAVEADGEFVGFVMVAETTEHHSEPYLWRLLIDRLHQRRGIGRRTLDLVIEHCRDRGDSSLLTSWVDGKGSPRGFYESYGFRVTGEIIDDETEARIFFG